MTHLSDVDINLKDIEGTPRLNANTDTKTNYQSEYNRAHLKPVKNIKKVEKKKQVLDINKKHSSS